MSVEYPDMAGYPDGKGFLDEGTALVDSEQGPTVMELEIDDVGDDQE